MTSVRQAQLFSQITQNGIHRGKLARRNKFQLRSQLIENGLQLKPVDPGRELYDVVFSNGGIGISANASAPEVRGQSYGQCSGGLRIECLSGSVFVSDHCDLPGRPTK